MVLAYAVAGLMVFTIARCLGEMSLADEKPSIFLLAHLNFRRERKNVAVAFPVPGGLWATGTVLLLLAGAVAILCTLPELRPALLCATAFLGAFTLVAAIRIRRADPALAEERK